MYFLIFQCINAAQKCQGNKESLNKHKQGDLKITIYSKNKQRSTSKITSRLPTKKSRFRNPKSHESRDSVQQYTSDINTENLQESDLVDSSSIKAFLNSTKTFCQKLIIGPEIDLPDKNINQHKKDLHLDSFSKQNIKLNLHCENNIIKTGHQRSNSKNILTIQSSTQEPPQTTAYSTAEGIYGVYSGNDIFKLSIFQQEKMLFRFLNAKLKINLRKLNQKTNPQNPMFNLNQIINNVSKFKFTPENDFFQSFIVPSLLKSEQIFDWLSSYIEFLLKTFIEGISLEDPFFEDNGEALLGDMAGNNCFSNTAVKLMFLSPAFIELLTFVPQFYSFLLKIKDIRFKSLLDSFRGYFILYIMYTNISELKTEFYASTDSFEGTVFYNSAYIDRVIALDCLFFVFVNCLENNTIYLENSIFIIFQSVLLKYESLRCLKPECNIAISCLITKNIFFCINTPYILTYLSNQKPNYDTQNNIESISYFAYKVICGTSNILKSFKGLVDLAINLKICNMNNLPDILKVLEDRIQKNKTLSIDRIYLYNSVLHLLFTIEPQTTFKFKGVRSKILKLIHKI